VSNRPYSGCNVVLLWITRAAGHRTPRFLTFKQALELGGNVRQGERGTKVYFVKQLQVREQGADDSSSTRLIPMMREYTVFNVDPCENIPDSINTGKPIRVRNPDTRDELADAFLNSTGADIREGHGEAYYVASRDFISMPAFDGFKGADHFYNVAFHELGHYADLRIMPRRCRSRGQVRRVSARHVGIIGLTEQAVVVPGSESNGTGILGQAGGRSARGSLAAVTLPDYRGDFRSWGRTGRARCGGTIHACDPLQTWSVFRPRLVADGGEDSVGAASRRASFRLERLPPHSPAIALPRRG
jgi:hypothetical protein